MEKKYLVIGRHEKRKVKEVVHASSPEQAKLRAGFKSGFGGANLTGFIRNRKIKVRRRK